MTWFGLLVSRVNHSCRILLPHRRTRWFLVGVPMARLNASMLYRSRTIEGRNRSWNSGQH